MNILAERGLPTEGLISKLDDAATSIGDTSAWVVYDDALFEAKVASSIRKFKRGARTCPSIVEKDGTWNRRAWEEVLEPSLSQDRELANALTYGEPIE